MADVSEDSARRRVPLGVLGMLALVALIEAGVGRPGDGLSSYEVACWRQSGEAARAPWIRSSDILCLGTSLVKCDVLPRVIEGSTGRRAFNLAVVGGPMPASYFLLRRALEAGARPSALVVDCEDPRVARRDRDAQVAAMLFRTRLWAELLNFRDLLDLSWSARDASLLARTCLSWASPSFRARDEIRALVRAAARGEGASSLAMARNARTIDRQNWTFNRGALVLVPGPTDRALGVDPRGDDAGPVPAAASSGDRLFEETLAGHYALRLARLAESHAIKVFWLLPPLGAEARAHRLRTGEDPYLVLLARTLQAKVPGIIVVDGRGLGYGPGAFADQSHLDRRGASTFSLALATVIARAMRDRTAGPAWVLMPRHRGPLLDADGVQDLRQSALFLKQGRAIR